MCNYEISTRTLTETISYVHKILLLVATLVLANVRLSTVFSHFHSDSGSSHHYGSESRCENFEQGKD